MIRNPNFVVPYMLVFALLACFFYPEAVDARPRKPAGIEAIYYNFGKMERTARNHMNPRFPPGDYVPTLRLTDWELNKGCLTAVNWNTRHYVSENRVLTIDLWDWKDQRWERFRCRAVDWQQRGHSTGSRQRFELDWETALAVNAVPQNTVARLISVGPRR